jgi:hypothetical protein
MARKHGSKSSSKNDSSDFFLISLIVILVGFSAGLFYGSYKNHEESDEPVTAETVIRPSKISKAVYEKKIAQQTPAKPAANTAIKAPTPIIEEKPVHFGFTAEDIANSRTRQRHKTITATADPTKQDPIVPQDPSTSDFYANVMARVPLADINYSNFKKVPLPPFTINTAIPEKARVYPYPHFSLDNQYFTVTAGEEVRIYKNETFENLHTLTFSGQLATDAAIDPTDSKIAVAFQGQTKDSLVGAVYYFQSWTLMDINQSTDYPVKFANRATWLDPQSIIFMGGDGNYVFWPLSGSTVGLSITDANKISPAIQFDAPVLTLPTFPSWVAQHTLLVPMKGMGKLMWLEANYDAKLDAFNSHPSYYKYSPPDFAQDGGPYRSQAITLSLDMQSLFSISTQGQISAYNIRTKQYFDYRVLKDRDGVVYTHVNGMVLAPNNEVALFSVSSPTGGKVLVYDLESAQVIASLEETDKSPIEWFQISPDGRVIVTGTHTGMVSAWVAQ